MSDRIAEIKARVEAATEGPWSIEIEHHRCYLLDEDDCTYKDSPLIEREYYPPNEINPSGAYSHEHESYDAHEISPGIAGNYDYEVGGIINTADAEFIAHAREDVPFLLAEIERLQGEHVSRDELARVIADAQNVPFVGPKQARIADAILERYNVSRKDTPNS